MNNFFVKPVIFLASMLVIFSYASNAQQNAYVTCVDASGNASICLGTIPESEIQEIAANRILAERGCGSGALSWTRNGSGEVPGINWAFLKTHCRNNRTVVIWTDLERGFFSSRTGNPFAKKCGRPYSSIPREEDWGIAGEIENDPCITYDFSVFDSGDGKGYINEFAFDLSDGDIFLISTAGGIVTVRQIDYNLTAISAQDIQLLASSYPEIRSFFEGQAL